MSNLRLRVFAIYQSHLTPDAQRNLIAALRPVLKAAPLFSPVVPGGGQMSVRMTSAGAFGWYSDAEGYRYAPKPPRGSDWPTIPEPILDIWRELPGVERLHDCCLIHYSAEDARMGRHTSKDQAALP